jgi:molybdopterin molybdotransferase
MLVVKSEPFDSWFRSAWRLSLGKLPGKPSTELLDVTEAQKRLLDYFSPLPVVKVHVSRSIGRVLADSVIAEVDLPSFPNSSMDGFAVHVFDVMKANPEQPVMLRVVADVPAGQITDIQLGSGQAIRIMTGAPIPENAEAVVPVEDTDINQRIPGIAAPEWVKVFRPIQIGENIRPAGLDVRSGEAVIRKGSRIRPQEVGLLSMLGVGQVSVHRKPRVAIFSTGNELLLVDDPLSPGKIHDSNTYMLVSLIEQYGCEPINLGIVPDEPEAVKACLDKALSDAVDLILSSAGVSVGAFDFVRSVVEQNGELDFWRVNMRPGKPLAFGHYNDVPYVGLPGNPVSAFVGFEVFVRPALLKLQGLHNLTHTFRWVQLAEKILSDGRESYLRAEVSEQKDTLVARLTGHQGSGNLRSLVQANALLIIPSGVKTLNAGTFVKAWLLGETL